MGTAVQGGEARRLLIMSSVVVVISLIFVLSFFRSCANRDPYSGYTVIYSNLELKDSADVVSVLKDQKIPYQIRDGGATIAVPKEKADDARLILAQKNLPIGGSVGWEIFNESKLGTTDFDRRIQLIRAISGELARTIRRIDAVQDARVQVVIPQTTLFEATQVPVTASVLLQLKPGRRLSKEQINGIVLLVSRSVENLRPENVSIVDIYGNILNGPESVTPEMTSVMPVIPVQKQEEKPRFEIIKPEQKEIVTTNEIAPPIKPEAVVTKEVVIPLGKTSEEKALLALKAKEEMEDKLSSIAQKIVNRFYPPNSILVKVSLQLEDYKPVNNKRKKPIVKSEMELFNENIKKMTIIILVDNRFNLTPQLKKITVDMVTSALPFYKLRGDEIIIKQVPFHYANIARPEMFTTESFVAVGFPEQGQPSAKSKSNVFSLIKNIFTRKNLLWFVGIIVFVLLFRKLFVRSKISSQQARVETSSSPRRPTNINAIEQMRKAVSNSPERVAKLLEKWLNEDEEAN